LNPFSAIRNFGTNPTQSLLPISECSHLDRFAITNGLDIRESYLLPLVAILMSNPCMNKNHDPVASGNKLFRFADHFGPGGT
jgi:hypothetical protein